MPNPSPTRLFQWLRWRLLQNSVGLMLRGSLILQAKA